jgi:hypothetical protein
MLLLTGFVLLDGADRERTCFFLVTGALVGWLALDDALQVHERVLPVEIGISQPVVLVVYGAATVAWLVRFRHHLSRDPGLLKLALGGFVASVVLDNIDRLPRIGEIHLAGVLEDYAKYVALMALLAWPLLEARSELLEQRRTAPVGEGDPAGTLRP